MSIDDSGAWLILANASGVGPIKTKRLLDELDTPENILACEHRLLAGFGLSDKSIKTLHEPDKRKIRDALEWLDEPGHHLVKISDADYPPLLKNTMAAPIVLFATGRREALRDVHFAIVGSRNPTANGKRLAEDFAYHLALVGVVICSGLALGIDYHSHLGALKADRPTVAVLGNGLRKIYPARHKEVAAEITEQGLLLSEFFPDAKPHPSHFPQRNRIISGLSTGVLVVEAAKWSGSLITANFALEQGREVFAVPGSIHNPLTRGTHSLIKQGARLVECIEDIAKEIPSLVAATLEGRSARASAFARADIGLPLEYKKLLDCMGYDYVSVDVLTRLSGLPAHAVSSILLVLELDGWVESNNAGKYCRILRE